MTSDSEDPEDPEGPEDPEDPEEPTLELRPASGFVEPAVADELPGLRLDWLTLDATESKSPLALVQRLNILSNGYRGAVVVAMRTKPVPSAYRTFFRQIGLDPDTNRIPSEEAALGRLFNGAFRPSSRIADALLIALIETGIPIYALDADAVAPGGPGIRTAAAQEELRAGPYPQPLAPGTLVVADSDTIHAVLFGPRAEIAAVTRATRRILLYTVGVAGVPEIHIAEAFWVATEAIRS